MPYRKETLPDGDTKSLRVLCAEDEGPIALLIKQALSRCGHFVECVEDGEDAIARINAQPGFFDLVITDHRMARTTGLFVVRKLRECDFTGRIVVHCSTLGQMDANAYRKLAVDHIFEKPIQSHDLIRVVATFVRPSGAK
jgi:CheY-like chemotaxis protein